MDILSLLNSGGSLLWTIAAFIVALSVIVAVHEYGHYIVGRWTGIKAEVFSIGFGKVLASRIDKHGTKWQVAALPFGGYVRFKGDSDAASGKDSEAMEALAPEDRRDTMHGAPLWARAATVLAGPVFNFILTILIVAAIVVVQGEPKDTVVVDEVFAFPDGVQQLESGDEVLSINDLPANTLEEYRTAFEELEPAPSLDYRVLRDGREVIVQGPWLQPSRIGTVQPKSAAIRAGLEVGDVILSIDGTDVFAFDQMPALVEASQGEPVAVELWRAGQVLTYELAPLIRDVPGPDGTFETRYLIGITAASAFSLETERPGPLSALWSGVEYVGGLIESTYYALVKVVTGQISTCNISGPITIATVSGDTASMGWFEFISFIAAISTAIGLVNLLPIPVLDGGHLVFHAYEAVTGRPPSDTALKYLMAVGLTLMLSLMVFALTNDIFCP